MFWTNVTIDILLFVFVLDCAFMGLVIMMQRSKQEGLGAAFGGGFTESIWGAQTSQVLVKATAGAAVLFFILSIALARLYSHRAAVEPQGSTVDQGLAKLGHTAPATNAAPAIESRNLSGTNGAPALPAAPNPSAGTKPAGPAH